MHAERLPRLDDGVVPPSILGTAELSHAAAQGAGPEDLAGLIAAADKHPAAIAYDTSVSYQLGFRRAEGLDFQDDALAASPLFRVRGSAGGTARLRLLALLTPGDLMVNAPLDFITNHLDVRLDLLYLLPDQELPATVPDHDIALIASSEPDTAAAARLQHLFAAWPRPVLNDPRFLPRLARDTLAHLLCRIPTIYSPAAAAIGRAQLDGHLATGEPVGAPIAGCGTPVLIRPHGSHAGFGLKKIDSAAELRHYLQFSSAKTYFVTAFVDYRSADGLFRKYRVAFIDRQPFLCHMAASEHWMVHYLNAGMTESAEKRADEARAMAEFDATFAVRHASAFAALHEVLGFDYYSIDCAETPDGRLLVFEADTAAIIHLMDPPDMFPYKHPQMRRVFAAFGDMLARRCLPAAPEPPVAANQVSGFAM